MAAACRTHSLENHELMSLCAEERSRYFVGDEDCDTEEHDLELESSEDRKGDRGSRSSVYLEIYGLQRAQRVHFSNQEYYRRLEELKNTHLRNIAELEKMYVSQGERWHGEVEEDGGLWRGRTRETRQPVRSLQRINSQEELDLHETSSGSDQSELCGEDGMVDLDPRRTSVPNQTCGRDTMVTRRSFQPKVFCPKPHGSLSHPPGFRVRSSSKVTVPKPFSMMQREEDRKRRKVRTRSEIELENTLLKRELEELRECRKTFRASPAPAHVRLPLYDMISRRSGKRRSGGDARNRDSKVDQASAATSPPPFYFLERERRKREAKMMAELGNLGQKEERRAFKATPMPGWAYGTRRRARSKTTTNRALWSPTEREVTEGQSDPNSESDTSQKESSIERGRSNLLPVTSAHLCDVTRSQDIVHI